MNIFPYRVRFTKAERLRFLSHHELMRVFERALRRTELPLRMTEGFNPHPILSFPVALGIGFESRDEVMELELASWIAPRKIQEQLGAQMPGGLQVLSVEAFHRRDREQVDYVEYEVKLPAPAEDLAARIEAFLAKAECVVERSRGAVSKPVEIRQYVMDLELESAVVMMRIRNTDTGTARPDEVLRALGVEPDGSVRIVKTLTALRRRS